MTDLQRALLCSAVAIAACGGNHASPSKTAASIAKEEPHDPSWPRLSWEDRHEVMTFTVQPNMGRAWQKFTKSDAPTMTCRTCHGANAEDVKYKMPNPKLLPLDPAHPPSEQSTDAREAAYTTFMTHEVVPQMIDLIDAPPTFGCFACHTKK